MSVNRNILYSFLTQIPTLILGILSGICITRVLGPAGKGAYSLFTANLDFFTLLLGFSFGSAFIYFISSDKIETKLVSGLSILITVFSTIIFGTILFVFYSFDSQSILFPAGYDSLFFPLYLTGSFFLATANAFISSIFQGRTDFKTVNLVAFSNSIFNFIIFGITLWYNEVYPGEISLRQILSLSFFALSVNSAVWFSLYFVKIRVKPKFNFSFRGDLAPLWIFIGFAHIGHLFNFLSYRLDLWLIEYFGGNSTESVTQLGYYSQAVGVAQLLWMIPNPIALVLAPSLTKTLGDQQKTSEVFNFFMRLTLSVVLPSAIILALIADPLVPAVYGEEFINSVKPLYYLLPGIVLHALTKIMSVNLYSRNKIKYNLYSTIAGVTVTLILDITLIPEMGIIGACIATSLSYLTIFLSTAYFLFVKEKYEFKDLYFINARDLKRVTNKIKVMMS